MQSIFNHFFFVLRYFCDRKARAASAQSFTLWRQATIEIMRRNHSIIACSRHILWVLFFAHIPFVVNRTFNATSTDRLQQSTANINSFLNKFFNLKANGELKVVLIAFLACWLALRAALFIVSKLTHSDGFLVFVTVAWVIAEIIKLEAPESQVRNLKPFVTRNASLLCKSHVSRRYRWQRRSSSRDCLFEAPIFLSHVSQRQ